MKKQIKRSKYEGWGQKRFILRPPSMEAENDIICFIMFLDNWLTLKRIVKTI